MKKKTHPKYYPNAKVTCACGAVFTTGSTKPEIQVEICSHCHPFFTGEMRYVDAMGKVEKFQYKQAAAKMKKYIKKKDRRALRQKKEEKKDQETPRTLREMLTKKKD